MFPKIDKIMDVIAADEWRYKTNDGKDAVAHIEVGKPQPSSDDPNGDWYCPVFIEGFTPRIVPAMGVGPVDSLMNAITLIRTFKEKIGDYSPRGLKTDK